MARPFGRRTSGSDSKDKGQSPRPRAQEREECGAYRFSTGLSLEVMVELARGGDDAQPHDAEILSLSRREVNLSSEDR